MRSSKRIARRVLPWVEALGRGARKKTRRARRKKLGRKAVRLAVLDRVLSEAIAAGVIPPADDAPARDWDAFFDRLFEIVDRLSELLLRLVDLFPSDADVAI